MSDGLVPGQRVSLSVVGHGLRTARVDAVEGTELLLVPTGAEPWPTDLAHRDATVEFPSRGGLFRASGTARRGPQGSIRFLLSGDLERIQRREWARTETTRPAQVRRVDADGAVVHTWTLDLSAGGARLSGPSGLQVGERVELRIRLDERSEIAVSATAEVARAAHDGQVGVRIAEIAEADRERIVRFVFEQQRKALLVNRGG